MWTPDETKKWGRALGKPDLSRSHAGACIILILLFSGSIQTELVVPSVQVDTDFLDKTTAPLLVKRISTNTNQAEIFSASTFSRFPIFRIFIRFYFLTSSFYRWRPNRWHTHTHTSWWVNATYSRKGFRGVLKLAHSHRLSRFTSIYTLQFCLPRRRWKAS